MLEQDTEDVEQAVPGRTITPATLAEAKVAQELVSDVLMCFGTMPEFVSIDFGYADVMITFRKGAFSYERPEDRVG